MRAIATTRAALCASMLLASTTAWAQASNTDANASAEERDTGAISDIVVTAQRREQDLQDVPIAVSAFSDSELETRQITRTINLLGFVPNLQGHNNTGLGTANTYSLRALQNTESIATFDPPVGTYVDDIYISRQNANNFAFFDVDRIEVLRGPQGTLFGRNTVGGAINVILKKPAETFGGRGEIGYGKYDRVEARASVDAPLIEGKLLSKISGYFTDDSGYLHNQVTGEKLNDERSWGVRGALRALLSDTTTWDLAADYTYSSYSNLVHFATANGEKRVNFTRLRSDTPLGTGLVSTRLADNTLGNTVKNYSFTSNFEVEAGDNLTVNFITGYRHLFQEFVTDSADSRNVASVVYDADRLRLVSSAPGTTTLLANDGANKQFSQEIKLTGKAFDGLVDFVGGIYYLNERNKTIFANVNVPLVGSAVVTQDRTMRNTTEAYAGYLQADVHPTDRLTLTAGIRYTDERKDITFNPNPNPLPRSGALNQPFSTQDLINAGIPTVLKAKVWTPRFAINYKATDDVMFFVSATKGFKSGGWNARANYAALAVPFTRETVWSYEAGVRSEFLDKHVRVNLTGFYFEDKDFQLPAGYLDPVTQTILFLTRNFADLTNYGLESEITIVPVDNFNIYFAAGMQKAKYKNIDPSVIAQQGRCLAGMIANNCNAGIITAAGGIAEPTRAPRFSSTLGLNYTLELGGGLELTPSGSWQYTRANWVSTSNDVRGRQAAHSVFNAGIALGSKDSGWSLSAECNNCTNKLYKTSFLIYSYLNEPGRWMVRAKYKF